jgi:hypothetical protein
MAQSERKRIIIDIPSDNTRYSRLYNHMMKSPDGVKKKVLDACDIQYYPFALIDSSAVKHSEVLEESILSVGRLYLQIQAIVGKLRAVGIQPTPEMLAIVQAGISGHSIPAASLTIQPQTTEAVTSPSSHDIEDDENDDDWIPSPEELAYMQTSAEIDSGLKPNG